ALKDHLINKGYKEDVLNEAGLLIKPEDGGESYDRFRGRVMFPILGPREAVIAFGGRALDPNARAKYLNSPETPLFHKGDILYNYAGARSATAAEGRMLIVCEGYMDVIALWGAGIKRAVAPLGTALTENQIGLLWRVSDEPVLCFDGDKAGLGAAFRAIDRALPLLKPGKSLSFAFLPAGKDPDDLVREGGAPAMQKALDAALPLADVLWRRETETRPLATPERRAALRAHLRSLVQSIADKDVRAAYAVEMVNRLRDYFAPAMISEQPVPRTSAGFARRRAHRSDHHRLKHEARRTNQLKNLGFASSFRREASLLAAGLNHPALLSRQEDAFLGLSLENPDLDQLLGELLGAILADPGLDSARLKAHLQATEAAEILERVLCDDTLNRQTFLRPAAEIDEVEQGWRDCLRLHLIATDSRRELTDSASQSFTIGENVWKAAVTAREELLNAGEGFRGGDIDSDATPQQLLATLERMRASVEKKKSKR
ncbi:MAG: DNA primase, partial [Amphiplicatus sp.]